MDTAFNFTYHPPPVSPGTTRSSSPQRTPLAPSPPATPPPAQKILPPTPPSTPPMRFSQFLSVARTGLDTLVRKSAKVLLDEAAADDSALVIEWRWESPASPTKSEAEDNALLDKDGWVEGWLD